MGKILFTHSAHRSGEYQTIDLRIAIEDDDYPQRNPESQRLLTLHWQQTVKEPDHGWYGFSMSVDCRNARNFDHTHSIMRKLQGKDALSLHEYTTPKDVLARLEALKAVECAYDPRESEWVPLSKIAPVDHCAWRDGWEKAGYNDCTVGCLAANERDAQKGIMAEFAKLSTESYRSYDDRFAKWLAAGKPVIKVDWSYGSSKPDVTPFAKRIK